MIRRGTFDRTFALLLSVLLVGGLFVFASGAFGLLARGESHITRVFFNHAVLGVGTGLVLLVIATFMEYRILKRYALYFYIAALCATALVFIPGVGLEHGGGVRWISLPFGTFQPGELLKLAGIVAAAAYFSIVHKVIGDMRYGFGGLLAILFLPAVLLLLQPDTGTLGMVVIPVCAIFFAAGAKWRDVGLLVITAVLALAVLAFFRPYVLDRITTFMDPGNNPHAQGYQIRQSLIAIGSGQLFGRGFGQGVQKFTYLPEPMGDSIFAVLGEELGFLGTSTLIILYVLLGLRGFYVALHAPELFGSLLAVGISTYLVGEAFVNIGAMVGIIPLTGIPLTFMSQGGSAMMVSLLSAGILLSVSRAK